MSRKFRVAVVALLSVIALALLGILALQWYTHIGPPLDLTGEWRSVENGDDIYLKIVIEGDTLELHTCEITEGVDSTRWIGSFDPPKTSKEPYQWVSIKDAEKTRDAGVIISSFGDHIDFTYENGELSFPMQSPIGYIPMVFKKGLGD